MKIGIMTYPAAINYGAALQSYALKKFLSDRGHQVTIINYKNNKVRASRRTGIQKVKSATWKIIQRIAKLNKKEMAFVMFQNDQLKLDSKRIANIEELNDYINRQRYDLVITGSDQVWNSNINGFDSAYYLNINSNVKKASYAASFGVSEIPQIEKDKIPKYLKSFDAISVREKTGREILKNIGFDSQIVLDPVFLLEKMEWNNISENRIVPNRYILCYVMPGDDKVLAAMDKIVRNIKSKTGYKIVYIGEKTFSREHRDDICMPYASPSEFLSLFRYAERVITNSFHGTAFSVIYRKQFTSVINTKTKDAKKLHSRIIDLLSSLDLNNAIYDINNVFHDTYISFENSYKKLHTLRKDSIEYLDRLTLNVDGGAKS